MTFLASVPIWVYFVIMAVTFMTVHVVAFNPNRQSARGAGTTAMRLGSSGLLLVALLVMRPAAPVTLLVALGLSALGGYLSGRAAPPLKPREPR